MANVFIEESTLAAIGNAIRSKTGSEELILPGNMPAAIESIEGGGGDVEAAWNLFWDTFQENGERTSYYYGFHTYWSDDTFKPKYSIEATNIGYAFQNSNITDLKGIFQERGLVFNTSNCTNFLHAFRGSTITRLPIIDTRNDSQNNSLQYICYSAKQMESIDKVILKEDGSQTFSYAFAGMSKLEEIRFDNKLEEVEGSSTECIGDNISFQNTNKLSVESMISIINALKSGVSGKTLTLGSTNLNRLRSNEQGEATLAIAENKGWTVK